MPNIKYIAAFVGTLVIGCASAGTAEDITNLENQLNQCRQEYKDLVAKTNQEIKDLKAKAPSNMNSIYAEKKKNLKKKADSCKYIKSNIEKKKASLAAEIEFKKQVEKIKLTGAIDKAGPRFRCLQLRQNWEEFSTCAKSLGLEANVGVTLLNETAFLAKNITAVIDETNHVRKIGIIGESFWNAGAIDESFIKAFVKQYDVENLTSRIDAFGVPHYKGTIRNGRVDIHRETVGLSGSVYIEYSESKGGYSF